MKLLQFAAIAGSALALSAGAAYAQYSAPPASSSSTGSMTAKPKVSSADMTRMKACAAMSHDAMMKDTGCTKMMKKHPDMMNSMSSGSTSSGSTSSGSMSSGSTTPKP